MIQLYKLLIPEEEYLKWHSVGTVFKSPLGYLEDMKKMDTQPIHQSWSCPDPAELNHQKSALNLFTKSRNKKELDCGGGTIKKFILIC